MTDFDKAVKFTLLREGFISNDPQDTGKLTIFGISSEWYPKEVKHLKKLINEGEIKKAKEYAINFYYGEFWVKSGCMVLPYPINICVFDCSVNCGRKKTKSLHFASGEDWKEFLLRRIEYYISLKGSKYYLRGWINRVISLFNLIKEENG